MTNSEQRIEKEIQDKKLNAPRLRGKDIDAVIVDETYTVLPSGKAMVCELTLKNGFTVRGESACVSKENFNEEIGKKIARENARDRIWMLEGYLLQEREYEKRLVIRDIEAKMAEARDDLKKVLRGIFEKGVLENTGFEEAIKDAAAFGSGVVIVGGSKGGSLFKELFAEKFQNFVEKSGA